MNASAAHMHLISFSNRFVVWAVLIRQIGPNTPYYHPSRGLVKADTSFSMVTFRLAVVAGHQGPVVTNEEQHYLSGVMDGVMTTLHGMVGYDLNAHRVDEAFYYVYKNLIVTGDLLIPAVRFVEVPCFNMEQYTRLKTFFTRQTADDGRFVYAEHAPNNLLCAKGTIDMCETLTQIDEYVRTLHTTPAVN